MAFLDNSGDIILDAVLTDAGRMRLARGDGTFRIVKFALGDDEIDYGLYDKNAESALQSITLLQTPVLEAFANNSSSMKSKLLTYGGNQDLLHLPIIKIYDAASSARFGTGTNAKYIVAVDLATMNAIVPVGKDMPAGVLNGYLPGYTGGYMIRADQGLDTNKIAQDTPIDASLSETQFLVQMDSRFGGLVNPVKDPATPATESFIDDDNIASYILTLKTDADYVVDLPSMIDSSNEWTSLLGPTGARIRFKIVSSTSLRTSSYLFTVLGSTGTESIGSMEAAEYKYIDTTISISGQTTGYRLDIPVRYVKKI